MENWKLIAFQTTLKALIGSAFLPRNTVEESWCARLPWKSTSPPRNWRPTLPAFSSIAQPGVWAEAVRLLLDVTAGRLSAMDEAGLDVQVLSLNAPGIQAEKDASAAVSRAKAVNDLLAETIAKNPERFAGFAALPLQDPKTAAKKLERAVNSLA
ncbi:amidohydrolase family protein [Bradyrhizobium sp. AS23.2]|uniref:amidohydrolase family protein n=1 Tax=Bradyrhizobium sp. AS23.2 TaxID=1680155 RepID=UPI001AD8080D|nr:amidohydrolase family protein [Bradyrhizobium sp. AS23.2]